LKLDIYPTPSNFPWLSSSKNAVTMSCNYKVYHQECTLGNFTDKPQHKYGPTADI